MRARTAITKLTAFAAVAALAAGATTATPAAAATGTDRPVLVTGDSLTHDAADEIRAALAGAGFGDVTFAAFGGTRIGWAAEQIKARGSHPIVVIASGTNNSFDGWTEADTFETVAAVFALAGRDCALWVVPATNRHPNGVTRRDAGAEQVAAGIRRTITGTNIGTAEWGQVANSRPDLHVADGTHHNQAGQHSYGQFIASSLTSRCGQTSRSVTPANDRYVAAAYQTFLRRSATASERQTWGARLDGGYPKAAFTRTLATSSEWIGVEVDALYAKALGRTADAAGREHWRRLVVNGMRLSDVGVQFYASAEFWQRSGSSNGAFIANLYRQILGREADRAGLAHWAAQMRSGMTRTQVAANFYASLESRRDRVTGLYQSILGREPDVAGREHWAERLLRDDDVRLAEMIATSQEFFNRAQH